MRNVALAVFVLASVVLMAQAPRDDGHAFEVASIRPSDLEPGDRILSNGGIVEPGGRWSARNATLADLVRTLYGVRSEQILGGPPWFRTERFVIAAKAADPSTSRPQVIAMAKRLLADRFKLRLHIEQRPQELTALVLSRRDGSFGPGLRQTTCVPLPPDRRPGNEPLPERARGEPQYCGTFYRDVVDGRWRYRMYGHTLRTLMILHRVEMILGSPVFDRTGLEGLFDMELEYTPDPSAVTTGGAPVVIAMDVHLGLRFERRHEPVDVLVIEGAELPARD